MPNVSANQVLSHQSPFRCETLAAMPKFPKKKRPLPPWVAKRNTELPKMTPTPSLDLCMKVRGTSDDEPFLECPDLDSGEEPCANGSECVARRDISGGPGYALKRMAPSPFCVLCLRREMKAKWVRHSVLEETVVTTRLCQRWESEVDTPGGYRGDCCIGPHGLQWNGFVSRVAVGVASDYTWFYDGDTKKWKIDQSRLYFREAPSISPRSDGALSDS